MGRNREPGPVIETTLKVSMYYNNHDIRFEDLPVPQIGDGEILMKVESSGICGSDLMEWYRVPKAPLVLGHEVAGEVTKTGTNVTKFKVGDRIVTTHHVPCNNCHYCLSDRHTVCPYIKETYFDPGGFSEYLRIPEINVDRGTFLLDDTVSYDEGSFVEPLGCVVRGHRVAGFKAGMSVAVIGSGITGLLNLQYAISQGAGFTCAIDVNEFKLKSAIDFGADQTFSANDSNISNKIIEHSGALADFVIVCTGVESAIEQSLSITEKGGTILFFAPTDPEYVFKANFNNLWWSGIKIVSSYAAAPKDLNLALKLIQYKKVNVLDMITHRLPLSETMKGFNLVEESKDSLKVIINPNV